MRVSHEFCDSLLIFAECNVGLADNHKQMTKFWFKQFTVWQDRCAMKVGTDGVLLGAWASGGKRILDIGTGTGLVALMMAQRFPFARVIGVDIDRDAVSQALDNVSRSPFFDRVEVRECAVQNLHEGSFDAIVCNPPFFQDSLISPDAKRTLARHTVTLTFQSLISAADRLLTPDGELSVIIPYSEVVHFEGEAVLRGFTVSRQCVVKTTARKTPKRCLLAFRRERVERVEQETVVLMNEGRRSDWYQQLTEEFYLPLSS